MYNMSSPANLSLFLVLFLRRCLAKPVASHSGQVLEVLHYHSLDITRCAKKEKQTLVATHQDGDYEAD